MRQISFKNTPFDENWAYKISLVGAAHLFSDKLEHHYILFSHGKYYDVYFDSDGILETKEYAGFSTQNCCVSSFYLCKNKDLIPVEYNEFVETKFGSDIEEKYLQQFGTGLETDKFVFFNNALFSKVYPKKEGIIAEYVFGLIISSDDFELYRVDEEIFVKAIGGA